MSMVAESGMLAEKTITNEIARIRRLLRDRTINEHDRSRLYGALQALSWVVYEDTAMPSRAFDSRV